MAFIDDIKQFFETGDYPTQAQFESFFQKVRWKDEATPMAEVAGLTTAITNLQNQINGISNVQAVSCLAGTFEVTLNKDVLYHTFVLISTVAQSMTVEFKGLEPFTANYDVAANQATIISNMLYKPNAAGGTITVEVTGTSNSTLLVYKF